MERIVDKETDLSRMMARPEYPGFIESCIPNDYKRLKHITITKKGLSTLSIVRWRGRVTIKNLLMRF